MIESPQLTLALGDFYSARTRPAIGETIAERFESFHSRNPHVYRALVALARQLKRQGQTRLSMKGLYEFLRMQKLLYTTGDDFKLNNNFTSLFARLVCEQEPELSGLFELRERRAA